MLERTLVMSFKDTMGKKVNLRIQDVKETIKDSDVADLMTEIIDNKIILSTSGELTEIVSAEIVSKETTQVVLY
ncbi:DUF2922 domain-containing protein [Clostridium sp.]|uniref:DUF2922 domain-containing protein n=1 Tax=Clostridium sp. TaxID=1506 RepID=UPI003F31A80F